MTDLELTIKAMNKGIIPAFNSSDIARLLETCDPGDARRMKRKFRKLWRREKKNEIRKAESEADLRYIEAWFSVPVQRRNTVRKRLLG